MSSQEWYCVRCRPQTEMLTTRILRRRNVQAFVPVERRFRRRSRYTKSRKQTEHPAIPGYVLLAADTPASAWSIVHDVPTLKGLLDNKAIPDADVARLERISGRQVIRLDQHADPLKVGQKVFVECGPFAWHEGVLQSLFGQRARVVLPIMGSHRPIEMPLANLAAL